MKTKRPKVKALVKTSVRHWLRPGQLGRVLEDDGRRLLVEFQTTYPGGGIDGNKLWFTEIDIAEAEETQADFPEAPESTTGPSGSAWGTSDSTVGATEVSCSSAVLRSAVQG